MGEPPTPDAPHLGKSPPPPPGALLPPPQHGNQLARARAEGLVTGPHAHTPCTHSQWVAGPDRTPQGRAVGRGRGPHPGLPIPRQEASPPRRPRAAPTARKASSQGQARPQGGERLQARQGEEGIGPPPQELNRRSTGPGQETRRGTIRLERTYRRPAPDLRVMCTPHRPVGGGLVRTPREHERTHTQ